MNLIFLKLFESFKIISLQVQSDLKYKQICFPIIFFRNYSIDLQ